MIKVFGWQHITYVVVSLLITVGIVIAVKKYAKSEKLKTVILQSVALFLFVAVLINRLAVVDNSNNWLNVIPSSFCGISSFVLAFSILLTKKDSAFMHFIVYIAFVGAVITLAYPTFIAGAASLFYPLSIITGLLHHSITLLLVVLVFATGYFKPDIKKWYAVILGLTCYMTYGLYLYDILNKRALSIGESFEGIKGLTWFNVGLIYLAAYTLFIVCYTFFAKNRKNKIK